MPESQSRRPWIGFVLGLAAFLAMLLAPLPPGMAPEAQRVAAVALLMACFWMTECVPLPATALLPIFLFPLLRVMETGAVTRSWGNDILFLFLGGFLIAVAMQKWQLHRRIALSVILAIGASRRRLVLGFMSATALLSMWISNTATAMMMMPVAMAVIEQTRTEAGQDGTAGEGFGAALMLAIAYAASIGGIATLVGTPPNAIFSGLGRSLYGYEIGFLDWMLLGLPVSLVMLVLCWLVLTRLAFRLPRRETESRAARAHIRGELASLGRMTIEERLVALVFGFVALAWILRGLLQPGFLAMVNDSAIAMAGAFVLFVLPAGRRQGGFLLDWRTAATVPWDIILLMGGGFALAAGFSESGLTRWLAEQLAVLGAVHFGLILLLVVLLVVFLTEMTSNAATATLFLPVMGALAVSLGMHPFSLMVPAALAASLAFMLPVATPPNAIVFGSRQVSIAQMAAAGLWLNLGGAVLISLLSYWLLPVLL